MARSAASTSSSASTTPMPLTPQSTGGPVEVLSNQMKKNRRQTAVYNPMSAAANANTPKPLKPFSRSAAKRESVLALGSIEHLQHYFSKTGIVSKKNPLVDKFRNQGLVPAIGGLEHTPLSPTNDADSHALSLDAIVQAKADAEHERNHPAIAPHVKAHEAHPDSLLPGVVYDLIELEKAWEAPTVPVDVLGLLKTSTRAIQSVRNYVLTLPDDTTAAIKTRLFPSSNTDPLALIRRSALDVLSNLRSIEERARLPLSDDAYDAQSDGGNGPGSRVASPTPPAAISEDASPPFDPSITFSLVQINGRVESVPVWIDEDEFDPFSEEPQPKRERWDQRLELNNGWLYRTDITPEDLQKEKEIVISYIDLVDETLFGEYAQPGEATLERNFEKVRQKLEARASRLAEAAGGSAKSLRSRSKNRRVSAADAVATSSAAARALFIDTSSGGKRRISTGVLGLGQTVTEEPDVMEGISEEGMWPGIKEEDEVDGEGDTSAGNETEEAEDDELPDWAQRITFPNDDLGRAYAFLKDFLPQPYHFALIPPSSNFDDPPPSPSPYAQVDPLPPSTRTNFLACLSSGQLLCLAYNACVRKSKHPWGFVSRNSVHDVLGLEAKEREREANTPSDKTPPTNQAAGWTFRRIDNLRLWVGGLKLRYVLPIQMHSQIVSNVPPSLLQLPAPGPAPLAKARSQQPLPTNPLSTWSSSKPASPVSPTGGRHEKDKDRVNFDAKVVARNDEGWEDMLEAVLIKWMWRAVEERRKMI